MILTFVLKVSNALSEEKKSKKIFLVEQIYQLISLRCQKELNQVLEVVVTIRAIRPFVGR